MNTDDVEARLRQLETAGQEGQHQLSVQQHEAQEAATSRRFITRVVLWTWVGSLAAYAMATAFGLEAAALLLDLVKISVLPVVTLVLGYYLGRSR